MYAFQSVYRQLEKALLQEGSSIPRFQILFYLYFEGECSQIYISKKLFVTRGNISMFFKRLLAEKLIIISEKTIDDKRHNYRLTNKGKLYFEKLFPKHIKRVKKFMPILKSDVVKILKSIKSETYE